MIACGKILGLVDEQGKSQPRPRCFVRCYPEKDRGKAQTALSRQFSGEDVLFCGGRDGRFGLRNLFRWGRRKSKPE